MELKSIRLEATHMALGAKMVPFAGFNMPVSYTSLVDEHMAVRNSAGIFDVSHMGEFRVTGKDAEKLLQKVTSNDVSKLYPGKVQYSCLPNGKGGIVDDLLVYKLSNEEFFLVVNASNIEKDFNWIQSHIGGEVTLTNESDDWSLLAIQGPKATELLQTLTPVKLSDMAFYTFQTGEMAGINNIIISATGYTGAGGFELYCRNSEAESLWESIMEAGKPHGLIPTGLGARDTLRLEKGYCLYGNDISDDTSPLEAGLGWITKPDTGFIGSELVAKEKEEGIKNRLVGFKLLEKGIPRKDYVIEQEGKIIGRVTSGTQSPVLQQGIGMGYVAVAFSKPDTAISIRIRNKVVPAVVIKIPFV